MIFSQNYTKIQEVTSMDPNDQKDGRDVGGSMARDIKKNFGIDLSDIGKDLAKDYLKESIFGKKTTNTSRSKFGRTLEALKGAWWVPAAIYLSIGLTALALKFLAKLVML